jgi:hypothetical protein
MSNDAPEPPRSGTRPHRPKSSSGFPTRVPGTRATSASVPRSASSSTPSSDRRRRGRVLRSVRTATRRNRARACDRGLLTSIPGDRCSGMDAGRREPTRMPSPLSRHRLRHVRTRPWRPADRREPRMTRLTENRRPAHAGISHSDRRKTCRSGEPTPGLEPGTPSLRGKDE